MELLFFQKFGVARAGQVFISTSSFSVFWLVVYTDYRRYVIIGGVVFGVQSIIHSYIFTVLRFGFVVDDDA
jgi:hypothetical protein